MLKRCFFGLIFISIISSCASTYYQKSISFQRELQRNNPLKALEEVNKSSFLKKKRNELLALLEKGKIEHLNKQYKASNLLFNKADLLIEDYRKNYGKELLSYLINPNIRPYFPQVFEKMLIYYYKALNFFALDEYEKALVEAKRINLKLQEINDTSPKDKKNRYHSDAFSLILEGLIYESIGAINDAFISYRNALELYQKHKGTYYGTIIPEQLKKDLIRTAHIMGFVEEQTQYESLFGINHKEINLYKSQLVLFWENGLGPIKEQTYYTFTLLPSQQVGMFTLFNQELNLAIPFPLAREEERKGFFPHIEIFNVAFPKYKKRYRTYDKASIFLEGKEYDFEKVQDINALAKALWKENVLEEITQIALRMATKKLSEHLLRKQNEALGFILGLFNAVSESADTRNWQTLPAEISYLRIPLKKGENSIKISFYKENYKIYEKQIRVIGDGRLKVHSLHTF